MAVRKPLYWNGSDLQEMSPGQIDQIKSRVRYLYSAHNPVTLSVVSSGGNLGTISDTRRTAGAYRSFTTRYPTEAETAEPGTVTVNYSRISQSVTSQSQPADTSNRNWPVYYDGSDVRAMSTTDMLDTFVRPAILQLKAVGQPGIYRIHTGSSLSGYTRVSSTPVFSDTRANTGAYTAGGIAEALDQPFTVTNYYLFRANNIASPSVTIPLYVNSDADLQEFSTNGFDTDLQDLVRWAAVSDVGYRVRYNINGTGTTLGSGMSNTVLNGGGNRQVRFVNKDDYRAQEFPNGTAVTAATYYLKVNLV